jgi:hypothetical protein
VKGRRPRYGIDVSTPLGPIDVYGELAFRDGRDFTIFRERTDQDPPIMKLEDVFPTYSLDGLQVLATAGASFSFNYTDQNMLILGAEYFYNPAGVRNPALHLPALYTGTFTPFYAGEHYLGMFAVSPGLPGFTWITLNLTNLVNLSDPSGIARLDAIFRVLTYLQLETFVSVNYGAKGGEFRFGADTPEVVVGAQVVPAFKVPYPVASAGVGLRVSL